MKLLILTQKIDQNDDVLGFFHRWVKEFSNYCEQVTVIALGAREYNLPQNVRVFSLGKERGISRFGYLLNFYRIIWRERNNYEAVFVHMNPVYMILGGVFWKIVGKKTALWYTHKHVDFKLRLAEKFTDIIFTASRESFRLSSKKIFVAGHGIDTDTFKPTERQRDEVLRITTVGRISIIKDYETLIDAVEILMKENMPIHVSIIGGPATIKDEEYYKKLKSRVREKDLSEMVSFIGPVSNKDIPQLLQKEDIFVNMSHTGSLDKAVLEAMSAGLIVVTSNEAFRAMFGSDASILMFPEGNARDCAQIIKNIYMLPFRDYKALSIRLRRVVEKKHNIEMLIPYLLDNMLLSKTNTS